MSKTTIPFETLVADLHGPDWEKRCDAARLLGQSRDPRAVDALLPDLHDPDWRVRRNAVQALGALKTPRAVEPLLQALNDKTNTVRQRAAVALGRIKDPQAIPVLIDALLDRKNDHVSQAAYQALRKFGRKAGSHLAEALKANPDPYLIDLLAESKYEGQTELLITLAGHTNSLTQQKALRALGQTKDPRAIEFLLDVLAHGDMGAQILAARSLGRLHAAQAIPKMLDLLQGDDLHGPLSGLYHAITEAFQILAGIKKEVENAFPGKFPILFGTSGASASLPETMGLLGDENFQRLNQMLANMEANIENMNGALNLPPEVMQHAADQTWKFGAMFANARDAKTERVIVLIELLKSESPLTRAAAALSLPWYADKQAVEPLEGAMQDPDETVRHASAWAHAALNATLRYQLRGGSHTDPS